MMRGLSSALKKIVRGERKAGAHSRFSPECRREAERTAAAGLQSFHRTSPDAHSAHRRISRTPEYRSPARRLICATVSYTPLTAVYSPFARREVTA